MSPAICNGDRVAVDSHAARIGYAVEPTRRSATERRDDAPRIERPSINGALQSEMVRRGGDEHIVAGERDSGAVRRV
jgi:hypothetical protein